MESLFILIPIAIIFVVIAITIFFWAVKSGQYDDLDTEARRILFDEQPSQKPTVNNHSNKNFDKENNKHV